MRNLGLTATVTDGRGGLKSLVFAGSTGEAVAELVDYCDLHGVKVVSVSSPQTILADVQGRKVSHRSRTKRMTLPESNLLGMVGRRDLLA